LGVSGQSKAVMSLGDLSPRPSRQHTNLARPIWCRWALRQRGLVSISSVKVKICTINIRCWTPKVASQTGTRYLGQRFVACIGDGPEQFLDALASDGATIPTRQNERG